MNKLLRVIMCTLTKQLPLDKNVLSMTPKLKTIYFFSFIANMACVSILQTELVAVPVVNNIYLELGVSFSNPELRESC